MKTRRLNMLFAALMSSVILNAQDIAQSEVPSAVLSAFQSKFQNPLEVEWKLKDGIYDVEFKINKREHEAWIDKSGTIKKHKEDFPKSQLPQVIRQKIETDFKGYKIDDADKIEENGEIFYEVDLDGANDDRELLFSASGELKKNKIDAP